MIFTELKMDKKEEGLLWIVTNRGKEGMYIKEELNELSSYSKSIYPSIRRDFNKIFNKLRGGY